MMSHRETMISYEEFQAEVLRRKRERWVRILAAEPSGRAPGRRPRDPEKEELLLRLDRARLAKRRKELESDQGGANLSSEPDP